MDDCSDLTSIHQRISAALAELGRSEGACRRTGILIQDGFCVGRQFYYDDMRVVWRVNEDALEFFGQKDRLLKRIALNDPPLVERRAA